MSVAQADRRIIPHAEVADFLTGAGYAAEAQRMLRGTADEIAEARRGAREQGFEEGRRAGLSAFDDAARAARARLAAAEPDLAAIVASAVEKIIGVLPREEVMRACLALAIAEAADSVRVGLRVAPEDLAAIRAHVDALNGAGEGASIRSVRPDQALKAGEMIVETLRGAMHIGPAQQIERLKAGLMQGGA